MCICVFSTYGILSLCVFVCFLHTPQIIKLCPDKYPTTIDILITDSTDDTIIQNINDVMLMEGTQDNILTTMDTITLQSIRHEIYYF